MAKKHIYINLMSRVLANGPRFNPRSSHTKDLVLDAALFNTQLFTVRIKGKVM